MLLDATQVRESGEANNARLLAILYAELPQLQQAAQGCHIHHGCLLACSAPNSSLQRRENPLIRGTCCGRVDASISKLCAAKQGCCIGLLAGNLLAWRERPGATPALGPMLIICLQRPALAGSQSAGAPATASSDSLGRLAISQLSLSWGPPGPRPILHGGRSATLRACLNCLLASCDLSLQAGLGWYLA